MVARVTATMFALLFALSVAIPSGSNKVVASSQDRIARGKELVWSVGCNDCHTPPNPVAKYVTKARNGFWHSFYFTVGGYPDPLRITPRNHEITEQACRTCHGELTASIEPVRLSSSTRGHNETLSCISCHRTVGHLE